MIPAATTDPSPAKNRRPSLAAGWPRAVFWLAVCGGLIFLAVRSYRRSDLLAVYTRAGNAQGIESHRGRVVIAVSNLSFGREKALTADFAAVPTDEGERVFDVVYQQPAWRREFAGFGLALSRKGDLPGDATHAALAVPHWFLATFAGLPAILWAARFARRLRRDRRTAGRRCWRCGYRLDYAPNRCPECGEPVVAGVRESGASV